MFVNPTISNTNKNAGAQQEVQFATQALAAPEQLENQKVVHSPEVQEALEKYQKWRRRGALKSFIYMFSITAFLFVIGSLAVVGGEKLAGTILILIGALCFLVMIWWLYKYNTDPTGTWSPPECGGGGSGGGRDDEGLG